MNIELKIALIRQFGSQIRAAKPLRIEESRLSRIVQCHREPTSEERERLKAALGVDYFSKESEGRKPPDKERPVHGILARRRVRPQQEKS